MQIKHSICLSLHKPTQFFQHVFALKMIYVYNLLCLLDETTSAIWAVNNPAVRIISLKLYIADKLHRFNTD